MCSDLLDMDTNTATDAQETDITVTHTPTDTCSPMDRDAARNKRENKETPERASE